MPTTFLQNVELQARPIISLHKFGEMMGVSKTTTWRWRRAGWLATVNIAGRQYVTDRALDEFKRRAEAGEFAKEHKAPKRRN